MRKIIVFIFLMTSSQTAFAGEDCTCSHKGSKVREGQSACIKTSKGLEMAQCSRVLNNTSWKFLGVPCPSANLDINLNQTQIDLNNAKKLLKKLS